MADKKILVCAAVLLAAGPLLLQACVNKQVRQMRALARVYDRPYDRVWSSVEELLQYDLKCAFKKNDRQDGLIETEWVHRIDTEGTKRWMVRAVIHREKAGVRVMLERKVEMQDSVSRSINKYKRQSRDTMSPSGGWKRTEVPLDTVEDLYRQLEEKLGP